MGYCGGIHCQGARPTLLCLVRPNDVVVAHHRQANRRLRYVDSCQLQ
jgi:hypothetical protein